MVKILYISLTGMTEPLGESQVVQYLLELAKQHSIYLLSFERPCDKAHFAKMQQRLKDANIHWQYFQYSNRFGILSTSWQIILTFFILTRWIKKEGIQVVHARSLVPAVIGMLLKNFYQVKLLFDIRGFAIDEKIIDGRLKEGSLFTRLLKKIEANVYKKADHIVTLTHASKPIIQEQYQITAKDITVIPTCASLELFNPLSSEKKLRLKKELGFVNEDFIILHNGSLNGWVDFEAELKLFEQLAALHSNAQFLFLNKGQHALIQSLLQKYQITKNQYKIFNVDFNKVSCYLNIADLCVFFIKPSFAKQASAPTKFAEIVACHLLSVTNTRYGDLEFYLKNFPLGMLLNLEDVHANPKQAAQKVMGFFKNACQNTESNRIHFNQLFSQHFSKKIAVEKYQIIYEHLMRQ